MITLEEKIKSMFESMGIELTDSPQILEQYIYIEFEDSEGSDIKIRIPYPKEDKGLFMDFYPEGKILYIVMNVLGYMHKNTKIK